MYYLDSCIHDLLLYNPPRLLKGGLLKLDYGGVLPLDEHNPNCRLRNACVRSGDERVNHNAGKLFANFFEK